MAGDNNPRSLTTVRVILALAVAFIAFSYRYLTYNGFGNDWFLHLAFGQQITMGDLPVRDYVERGMPLMAGAAAAGQHWLGPGIESELIVISFAFGVAAALVFVIASDMGSVISGLAAATMVIAALPVGYSYPKLVAYALALAAGAAYARRPTPARMTGLAASIAIAFLFRHDHGVLLAVGGGVLMLARHGWSTRSLRNAGVLVAISLLFVAPYLMWVQVHGGLVEYLREGAAFSTREAEKADWLALPRFGFDPARPLLEPLKEGPIVNVRWRASIADAALAQKERAHGLERRESVGDHAWQYELTRWSGSDLESLVTDPDVADTHGIDRRRYRLSEGAPGGVIGMFTGGRSLGEGLRLQANGVAAMFYLAWILPLLAIVVAALARSRLRPTELAMVTMMVVVQFAMNVTMLRDPLNTRVRDVIVPLSLLAAFLAGALWRSRGPYRYAARLAAVMLLTTGVTSSLALGAVGEQMIELRAGAGIAGLRQRVDEVRSELVPPLDRTGRISDEYRRLVDYISACTAPTARIFTLTFAPELFIYTGRGFAAGQVAMTPGFYRTEHDASLMLSRLKAQDVPIVVMDSETAGEIEAGYPLIVAYVRQRYDQVDRVRIGEGRDFLVLARREGRTTGAFGNDRLPCFRDAAASASSAGALRPLS